MQIQAYVYTTVHGDKEECTGESGDCRLMGYAFCIFVCLSVSNLCPLPQCVCVSSGIFQYAHMNTCMSLCKCACVGATFQQRPWASKENEILKNIESSRY